MSKINFQITTLTFGAVTDLLNGAFASLSGPVGFTAPQPRILVKSIRVTNPLYNNSIEYAIYKGASGAAVAGTEVLVGNTGFISTTGTDMDLVLDASDFLTGRCISNGSVTVDISAEIYF